MRFSGFLIIILLCVTIAGLFQFQEEVAEYLGLAAATLFTLFHDEAFPLLLAGGVLAAAVVLAAAYLLFVVIPIRFELGRLRRAVNHYAGEPEFAADFDFIAARLKRSGLVGHAWSEFRETLVVPEQPGHVVQNTTRPHTFINYHNALDRSTALRLMPHLPNYFVGVGLLLTFVGLVAALNFANSTVGGDIDAAILGLQDLLAAATFKFWTSIAGLVSSILLSFFFRLYGLALESGFGHLCRALESKMLFATPQRTFFEVRDTIREQLDETKKINTEVAVSIADGIGRQMEERFPPLLASSLEPLVGAVQDSADRARSDASGNMQEMVGQFAETLESSAGQHLKDVSATLEGLNHSLDRMQGSMNTSGEAFSARMADGAERLDATMRDVGEAMRHLVESLRGEVGSAGSAFSKGLEDGLGRLLSQTETMAAQIGQQSQASAQTFSQRIDGAAQRLDAVAADWHQSSQQAIERIQVAFGTHADGIQAGLNRLNADLGTLGAQVRAQSEAMSKVTQQGTATAQAMGQAAQSVRAGLKPFQDAARDIAVATEGLQLSVGKIADRMEKTLASAETVSGSLTSVSETVTMTWDNYRERFEAVDEDLEKAFTQLQTAVAAQQARIQEFVGDLDASLTKATEGLQAGIDQLGSIVEDLVDQTAKAAE